MALVTVEDGTLPPEKELDIYLYQAYIINPVHTTNPN